MSNNPQEFLDYDGLAHLIAKIKPQIADAKKAGTDAQENLTDHNTDTEAHNDLRLELAALSKRINDALDSEDVDLDQLSEIVTYIKSNKDLIDAITTSKVSVTDIVNDLVTNVANKPLSAAQGVALKKLIDNLNTAMPEAYTHPTTSGNKHIPSGGTYGQFLKWSADGTAVWSNDNNTRAARKVVGTSANGWTARDCDYLCDGTADQEEINAAINALPSTGGEVILLDGTYNITAQVDVSKSYTTLRGAGQATKLVRAFDGDEILYLAGGYCTIEDINIDGKSGTYKSTDNRGIYFLTGNNLLKGLIVRNNAGYGICAAANYNKVIGCTVSASRTGIRVDGDNCIVSGNIVHENTQYGIDVNGNHNVVDGNVSRLNASANFYIYSSTYNTICNNDFSVVSGDSVTPKSIYLAGTSNENNIITNNNVGVGAVTVSGGTNNIVGNPVTREEWQASILVNASVE